jgi:hypothetical protein
MTTVTGCGPSPDSEQTSSLPAREYTAFGALP